MMSFVALSYLVLVFSVKDITLYRAEFFFGKKVLERAKIKQKRS